MWHAAGHACLCKQINPALASKYRELVLDSVKAHEKDWLDALHIQTDADTKGAVQVVTPSSLHRPIQRQARHASR